MSAVDNLIRVIAFRVRVIMEVTPVHALLEFSHTNLDPYSSWVGIGSSYLIRQKKFSTIRVTMAVRRT